MLKNMDFGRIWSKFWILVDFGQKSGFCTIMVKKLDFGRFWSKIKNLIDFGQKYGLWSILVKNLDFGRFWPKPGIWSIHPKSGNKRVDLGGVAGRFGREMVQGGATYRPSF